MRRRFSKDRDGYNTAAACRGWYHLRWPQGAADRIILLWRAGYA